MAFEDIVRIAGFIIIIATVAVFIYTEAQKRIIFSKLQHLYRKGDFEGCLEQLQKPTARFVFPRYNYLYMKLNAYIALEHKKDAVAVIDQIDMLKMTKKQQEAFYRLVFNYFVEIEDRNHAESYFEKIKELGNKELTDASKMSLDIFFHGSYAYIDRVEKQLSKAEGVTLASLYQVLSIQYTNKGDKKRAADYEQRARDTLEDVAKSAGQISGQNQEQEETQSAKTQK